MKLQQLVLLAVCVTAASWASQAQSQVAAASGTCVQVEVRNVRAQQGLLMVAAYSDAESYQKKPVATLRVPAGEATMKLEVCGLQGREVAFALFQDLDSDGKMGRNMVGIPTEPWGSSGTPGAFGPTWESSRVPLDGKTIVLQLSV